MPSFQVLLTLAAAFAFGVNAQVSAACQSDLQTLNTAAMKCVNGGALTGVPTADQLNCLCSNEMQALYISLTKDCSAGMPGGVDPGASYSQACKAAASALGSGGALPSASAAAPAGSSAAAGGASVSTAAPAASSKSGAKGMAVGVVGAVAVVAALL
ncbi:hypothetical protein BC830DRAFT_1174210 [Chytriomyces sp. MP71]|nr:hypothetical protein BC830DRAFT_1174916 [Chytriomyces sp. MP71]KAI8608686.1 hypothetical protein BC830DRAFT_1174210 [Chytriomyces sp. MP71]